MDYSQMTESEARRKFWQDVRAGMLIGFIVAMMFVIVIMS